MAFRVFFWAIYVKIRNTMGCERSEHMSSVSLHTLTLVNCLKIRFWSKNQQKLAFFCSKLRKWAIFTRRLLQKSPSKFFKLSINPSPRILLQMGSFKVKSLSPDIELFIFVKKSDRNFDQARRNFYQDAIFPQKSTKKVKQNQFFQKLPNFLPRFKAYLKKFFWLCFIS